MSTAAFDISGSPSTDVGYDADNSEVLSLSLEDNPAPDIWSLQYSTLQASKDAPALAYSDSGSPDPVTDPVTTAMSATGLHAYIIQSQANGGKDANGNTVAAFTKQRLVVIRAGTGMRKIVVVETTQYDAEHGWEAAINTVIDLTKATHNVETLAAAKTLTKDSERFQKLDPDGGARNVDLPAEASSAGLSFYIENTGGLGANLTVRNDTPATVVTLANNRACWAICDGTDWAATGIITVA